MKSEDLIKSAKDIVNEFLLQLGLDGEIECTIEPKDDEVSYVFVKINGDHLQEIIGYHGVHLEAMQVILSLIFSKKVNDKKYRLVIDVNDFKVGREKDLKSYALRAAEQVRSSRQTMELRPMKPYERRIVHMTLKEEPGISVESIDEGENRRIKITSTEELF